MSERITMPQLGETVTEGTILRWLVNVGDSIKEDDPILEISTDKVDTEVPSPFSGTVSALLVEEGETVEVGSQHLTHDESLIAYGEECRDWGGAFGVHRGFADIIPYHRLFNSPISEAAIVSTAVGYALAGGRAIVELMYGR